MPINKPIKTEFLKIFVIKIKLKLNYLKQSFFLYFYINKNEQKLKRRELETSTPLAMFINYTCTYIYKLYDFGSVLHISDTTFSNFNFIKNKELLKIASYLYENSILYIDLYSKKKYITSIMNSPEFEDIKNI